MIHPVGAAETEGATPVLELTVSAKVNPAESDAMKHQLLERASALIAAA